METIAEYGPGMLLALGVFSLGLLSPGPNILAVIGTSMASGRAHGVALALGIGIGSGVWGALAASGMTALLSQYAIALTAIKVLGGCYLLWLAIKAFGSAASPDRALGTTVGRLSDGPVRLFGRGLAIQLTNPKAALTWVAIISLGLNPDAPVGVVVALVFVLTILSVMMHVLYAAAFSTQAMVKTYARLRRWIDCTLGIVFALAGLRLIFSRS